MEDKRTRYTLQDTVGIHMTDADGICRAADTLRLMQDAAMAQLEAYGPTRSDLDTQEQAFILSRISMEFSRPLYAYDRVRTVTWPSLSSTGVTFDRLYTIEKEGSAGEYVPVAAAVSQWALMDRASGRPLRVSEHLLGYEGEGTVSVSLPARVRIPKDASLVILGQKEIRYSDIDQNRHLNNTHYPALFCDFLPMEGMRVSAMSISFLREAPLGEVLTVMGTEAPDDQRCFYLRTLRASDGAVNAEAVVKMTPAEPAGCPASVPKQSNRKEALPTQSHGHNDE